MKPVKSKPSEWNRSYENPLHKLKQVHLPESQIGIEHTARRIMNDNIKDQREFP